MKAIWIGLIVIVAGLGIWRYMANRVDFAKPESVSKAFIVALKGQDIDKAAKYWVPAASETWRTDATQKVKEMQTGTATRFFEDLPDGSAPFVATASAANAPTNEQSMTSGGTTLRMRNVDGKWYVCNAPL